MTTEVFLFKLITSKQYPFEKGKRSESDHVRSGNAHLKNFINLTINDLNNTILITSTRAIAQFGRATRLHARQCFFRGFHQRINIIDLIDKSKSYSLDSRNRGNNSLTNSGLIELG
ncbi:hypothetical protein GCM10007887_43570 [Methylobacterium haplocladii]|nr:hypothetical protein GCM10007887_43570 [Methylobacterium haplocladii]